MTELHVLDETNEQQEHTAEEVTPARDPEQEAATGSCPPWCVAGPGAGRHTHASADTRVETLARPLNVQLVQVGDSAPRLLVDGQVATLQQATSFASAIRRMADAATLAEPGLGFVLRLASNAGITLEAMAQASGIDPERLTAQREGGQVMTVHEVDGLALAVAGHAAERRARAV
jgi:hypothetical protein